MKCFPPTYLAREICCGHIQTILDVKSNRWGGKLKEKDTSNLTNTENRVDEFGKTCFGYARELMTSTWVSECDWGGPVSNPGGIAKNAARIGSSPCFLLFSDYLVPTLPVVQLHKQRGTRIWWRKFVFQKGTLWLKQVPQNGSFMHYNKNREQHAHDSCGWEYVEKGKKKN